MLSMKNYWFIQKLRQRQFNNMLIASHRARWFTLWIWNLYQNQLLWVTMSFQFNNCFRFRESNWLTVKILSRLCTVRVEINVCRLCAYLCLRRKASLRLIKNGYNFDASKVELNNLHKIRKLTLYFLLYRILHRKNAIGENVFPINESQYCCKFWL